MKFLFYSVCKYLPVHCLFFCCTLVPFNYVIKWIYKNLIKQMYGLMNSIYYKTNTFETTNQSRDSVTSPFLLQLPICWVDSAYFNVNFFRFLFIFSSFIFKYFHLFSYSSLRHDLLCLFAFVFLLVKKIFLILYCHLISQCLQFHVLSSVIFS